LKVGIYFIVEVTLIMDAVDVKMGEPYGEAIQYGGHYEFWEKLKPETTAERKLKTRAYDAYPRGRVVYFPRENIFIIYHDRCLKHKELAHIKEQFGLNNTCVKFQKDEHYQCSRCNPMFMD